ncbi:MAG: insulinase family protein [candidate division Zixibacteria bacterium]|nr:insulinase family protein [candidate division Zixibacteria bacterium]
MKKYLFIPAFIILAVYLFLPPLLLAQKDVVSFEVNGLKVIFKKVPTNQVVSANLYFKGGAQLLSDSTQGIELFLLNSSKRETRNFPKDVLSAELDRMGSQIGAEVSSDYSTLSLRCITDYFDRSWEIFSDVILNPALSEKEINLVRQQMINAAKNEKENPDPYIQQISEKLFYVDHPYYNRIRGTEESLARISPEELKTFHKDNLVNSRLLLVVVGNLDESQLKIKIEKTFSQLPAGDFRFNQPPYAPKVQRPELRIVEKKLPTNYIMGFYHVPNLSQPDYASMKIALSILDDRLFEELRTKRNLTYAVSSGMSSRLSNFGYLYITTVDPDSAMRVMLREVDKLQSNPVSQKELIDAVNVFLTNYYLGLETNRSQADFLARGEISGIGWQGSFKFVAETKKLTPKDIESAAKAYIQDIHFGVLGDTTKIDQAVFTSK